MSSSDAPLTVASEHQLAIRLHPADAHDDSLDVTVFTAKLNALVSALVATDKAANGKRLFSYRVAKLQSSSPTALISEIIPRGRQAPFSTVSPIRELRARTSEVVDGRPPDDARYSSVYRALARLSNGARRTYEYGELWLSEEHVFRIDGFLEQRAKLAEAGYPREKSPGSQNYFTGVALGTFEGVLDYVDLRGSLPAIKLAMSIGGSQLDCVCQRVETEKIRAALGKRALVKGRAIYDGSAPLPRRVEVFDIDIRATADDFDKWKGAIDTFHRLTLESPGDE